MIMLGATAVLLLLAPLGSVLAPRLARGMAPAAAARTLTLLALTTSLTVGLVLCAFGTVAAVELLPTLRPQDWAVRVLHRQLPLPPTAGAAAGFVGLTLLALAVVHVVRLQHNVRRTIASTRDLPSVNGLAIVESSVSHAFAVPGRHPRVVVSTGLLQSLSGPQRRAVLAHERAHLEHRHYVYAQLARVAAAANPLMRRVSASVDVALERWADAEAATRVGDRRTVATALAAIALPAQPSATVLHAARSAVVERVRFLLHPPVEHRINGAVITAVAAASWLCAAVALWDLRSAIEWAEVAVRR